MCVLEHIGTICMVAIQFFSSNLDVLKCLIHFTFWNLYIKLHQMCELIYFVKKIKKVSNMFRTACLMQLFGLP